VLQALLSGLAIGAIYGLVGMGFAMAFYVTRVINFAEGQLLMVAVMVTASLARSGLPSGVAIVIGIAAAGVMGAVTYFIAVKPVLAFDRFSFAWLVSTLGVALILENLAALIWGSTSRSFPVLLNGRTVHIGGAVLTLQELLTIIAALVLAVAFELFRRRTLYGKLGMAIAYDPEMASAVGANTTLIAACTFALAGVFAGVAGVLIGPITYSNPYLGEQGDANLARIANSPFQTFQNARFSFQYPSSATAQPLAGAANGSIDLEGPYLAGPPFSGAAYGIVIRDFGVQSDRPLDEWGYDTLQQEIAIKKAEVEAEGGPSSIYQPLSATFFRVGANDVFQIDYFAGDSTLRDFYVQHTGGGSIIGVSTRVYPVQNNQGAPLAESAVTLLLQSLKVTGE